MTLRSRNAKQITDRVLSPAARQNDKEGRFSVEAVTAAPLRSLRVYPVFGSLQLNRHVRKGKLEGPPVSGAVMLG
jgi:hypothetical protein